MKSVLMSILGLVLMTGCSHSVDRTTTEYEDTIAAQNTEINMLKEEIKALTYENKTLITQQDNLSGDLQSLNCKAKGIMPLQEDHSNEFITYEEYQNLFNKMKKELSIPRYALEKSTPDDELTIIDEEISFGERKYITKDGEFTGIGLQSTQKILFYQNNEGNRLLTLTIAYTPSMMSNDIVYYNMISGYNIDEALTNKADLITLSYKNLIISILQTALDERDMNDTIEATKEIVDFLEKEDM
ncbi:hypothetical protein [Caldalkalibacillus salinus]|uniref:hypothetical protein n=1 Tax=Caldalkalibacillus salinus TaxID=2803787 RepID=UPI0019241335|nr:hypothetical protein [Caldalkalibacillus salinus]